MSNGTILVTGGTGKTGRRVAELLRERGQDVRAVSRNSEIRFDWDDDSTWPDAVKDVAAVYIVTTSLHDPSVADQFRAFGELVVASGATRAVLVSVPDDGHAAFRLAQAAEAELTKAGLGLAVLRLRWFNQNFSEDFLAPFVDAGDLRLPAGHGAEAFVDADDIAEVAALALTDDSHAGRTYELTGPRLLTFADVAQELSAATGRTITYTPLEVDAYVAEQIGYGVPEEWARLSATLYANIAAGALQTVSSDIADVLGRPARDFRDFAASAVRDGAWLTPSS
ncbi:NmrA family NAD(P)-binding protein [Pseudoclavibacter sp. RFBA6]|uniref:NmrA family NAD(P)-binding protein n=1 Tax=Pseudoclavibacter sp. RFBA6 TaxID=2080573 RepID=UPI000CE76B61|nr:NmrA family NAD(P)-binding protein [Pseudoclavibacter sp. RFBA6]PPG37454.1 NmrA family transcriptional regulator [Pseudoclavibacter sp. RFBA6]